VVPYQEAWDFQREQASRYAEAQIDGLETDRVILLQHEPVYTLGAPSHVD
jgi:lipoate-protein ligase B